MQSPFRLCSLALPVLASLLLPASADAGRWWYWGHPGYADGYSSSFYAPYSGYAAYGPSYYGPAAGCCGSGACGAGSCGGCNSCQLGYAPACGCDPCGCNSCGGGCGVACADGSCAGGNCNLNQAPADGAPVPDPNVAPTPITPRSTTPPARTAPPRTFDEGDAPRYEPPNRTAPPAANPMNDPMGDFADPAFPPPRSGGSAPPSRSLPPMGTDPLDDGFRSRPPSRSPLPTDPLNNPIDPGSVDPATGFGAAKEELPTEEPSVISPAKPVATPPLEERPATPAEAASELQIPALPVPTEADLDLTATTRPVVERTRLQVEHRKTYSTYAGRPALDREWSVAPSRLNMVRQ